jgi:hypothetical protein
MRAGRWNAASPAPSPPHLQHPCGDDGREEGAPHEGAVPVGHPLLDGEQNAAQGRGERGRHPRRAAARHKVPLLLVCAAEAGGGGGGDRCERRSQATKAAPAPTAAEAAVLGHARMTECRKQGTAGVRTAPQASMSRASAQQITWEGRGVLSAVAAELAVGAQGGSIRSSRHARTVPEFIVNAPARVEAQCGGLALRQAARDDGARVDHGSLAPSCVGGREPCRTLGDAIPAARALTHRAARWRPRSRCPPPSPPAS